MAVILVTGASGMLGGNLAADWAGRHEVHGVFHQHRLVLEGVQMIGADLADPQQARTVMGKVQPDLVVHCAAATDLDQCERDPDWAMRLNRDMAKCVAAEAQAYGSRVIHISTDAVFDGKGGPYQESDPAHPLSAYGQSKLAGEPAVLAVDPSAVVARTNLFGWSLGSEPHGLAEWFLSNLRRGEACTGFTDVHFSPVLVNDLGTILLKLFGAGAKGLFHVGGADCLSKYEFGLKLAQAFGYPSELIKPGSLDDADLKAPRARRLCLDSSKAEGAMAVEMPDVDDGIQRMRASVPPRWTNEMHGLSPQLQDAGERREK